MNNASHTNVSHRVRSHSSVQKEFNHSKICDQFKKMFIYNPMLHQWTPREWLQKIRWSKLRFGNLSSLTFTMFNFMFSMVQFFLGLPTVRLEGVFDKNKKDTTKWFDVEGVAWVFSAHAQVIWDVSFPTCQSKARFCREVPVKENQLLRVFVGKRTH